LTFANQEELDATCDKWQEILRLRDWTVTAKIVPGADLPHAEAQCHVSLPRKSVFIEVARERASWAQGEQDDEASLVHELLHCHFEPFSPQVEDGETTLERDLWEQCIDQLSIAFVNLERDMREQIVTSISMAFPPLTPKSAT
jgi:hypothetical protein